MVDKKEEFKFGVKEFAKELGVVEATARLNLRNAKIKRSGKSYGWMTRKDFDEDLKKVRSVTSAPVKKKAPAKTAKKAVKKAAA